jgi:hypothetical protein
MRPRRAASNRRRAIPTSGPESPRGANVIGIRFEKKLVEQFLDAIQNAKPIHCEWSQFNMLSLAGTLYFAALSQGPLAYKLPGAPKMEGLHRERREAVEESFHQDIHDAIEFCGHLATMVKDGEYDEWQEPVCQALLQRKNGRPTVTPMKGFKGTKGPLDDQ